MHFGPYFQLSENERTYFRWGMAELAEGDPNRVSTFWIEAQPGPQLIGNVVEASSHQTFDRTNAIVRKSGRSPARRCADNNAALRIQTDDRGAAGFTVRSRNAFGPAARFIDICNQAKTRSQINPNCP